MKNVRCMVCALPEGFKSRLIVARMGVDIDIRGWGDGQWPSERFFDIGSPAEQVQRRNVSLPATVVGYSTVA
jgi:hypothetical protein